MLPEQTLLPEDIVSKVQGAVPNYVVVLNDIKGITAWADEVRAHITYILAGTQFDA
jgi:hypothetical protein